MLPSYPDYDRLDTRRGAMKASFGRSGVRIETFEGSRAALRTMEEVREPIDVTQGDTHGRVGD